jgi:squalene-associated FAD-dependent desaturase
VTTPHIAIIGAGWAGLTTACDLASQGIQVTVFEAGPNPGGRARGFARNGLQLDNGQHILLGAYRETLRLMQQAGLREEDGLLRLPLRLFFPHHLDLDTLRLPAPLHLLTGLLTATGLNAGERWAALRLMTRLRLLNYRLVQDITVAELLAGQPEKLIRLLWEPLCLAALNTPLDQASAQVFLNVLRDSFSHARADSDLLLPCTDLSTLLPIAAMRFIESHSGQVRLATRVTSVEAMHDGVTVNGERFSHLVCAVAPHAVAGLLEHLPEMSDVLGMLDQFSYQPIATVYLQYPAETRLDFPMLGMTGGHAQWVFDRGALCGQPGLLSCVISAEGPHMTLDHDTLAEAVHGELQALLGSLPPPEWQQVIVEKRATFSCTPDLQRPAVATPHPRIFLAGDYTASDYPATLEGAVRSGVQCAQTLMTSLK